MQWDRITSTGEDKDKAFEELCYQIVDRRHGSEGQLIRVDDSGGGDGVEFYLQLPNGEEWGWQSKFFHPNARLNVSGRKTQIRRSLKKAWKVHPKLTRWILCTPTDFTPPEQKWFEEELPRVIPQAHTIRFEHWGSSRIETWLGQPDFSGMRLYFFGELELSLEWFKVQLECHGSAARKDFEPLLHMTTDVDEQIHNYLGDKYFLRWFGEQVEALQCALAEVDKALHNLTKLNVANLDWNGINQHFAEVGVTWQTEAAAVAARLEWVRDRLLSGDFSPIQEYDWLAHITPLTKSLDSYNQLTRQADAAPPPWKLSSTKPEEMAAANRRAYQLVREPLYAANSVRAVLEVALRALHCLKQPDITVLGGAGVGKTHIVYNLCFERLQEGLPALYLSGRFFNNDRPLTEQLLRLLDIPASYSWSDFLAALSTAARVYRTRIPLVIDGLNEVGRIAPDNNVWTMHLPGLTAELRVARGVLLVATARSSYREAIWGDCPLENAVDCEGFSSVDVHEAVQRYFDHYRIEADLSDAPLEQFQHPIYLKIFCEATNPERQEIKQVYVGEQSLFEVFDAYLTQVNQRVRNRLGLRPNAQVVRPALEKMAQRLWKLRARSVPLTEFMGYLDESPDGIWTGSKTQVIFDEGLITYRDWECSEEIVSFTYDLLGGYLIALHLFQQNAGDLANFVNSSVFADSLLPAWGQGHPLMEDIGRCFAALVAIHTRRHLHEFNDDQRMLVHSVPVIFEIPPTAVTETAVELIQKLFERPPNRTHHLRLSRPVLFQSAHPLNAYFWTEQLKELSMVERDTTWTEFIRENVEQAETIVKRLEELCSTGAIPSTPFAERIALMAQYAMWLLTSTVRSLRDLATRALYWYGRRHPEPFFRQVVASLEVNDPYVPERMLGAACGVCLAWQQERKECSDTLANFGRQIYQAMFVPQAPHTTNHILMRDYARRVVGASSALSLSLFTLKELARSQPPYKSGGIRKWGQSKDRDKEKYSDGNAPIQLDFGNYTLGALVKGRGPYDFEHPEYQRVRANIFWRLYDLGYSLAAFSEVDQVIARGNWHYGRSADGRKTDRYGKKYAWIAYYEIAGYRADKGLINSNASDFIEIDISFPERPHRHRLVTESFLGQEVPDTKNWIVHGGLPAIKSYFVVPQLLGEGGPWVLLDGYVNQESEALKRSRFTFLRAFFVPKRRLNALLKRLASSKADEGWPLSKPSASTMFAADLPPGADEDFDSWYEMRFKIGTKWVTVSGPIVEWTPEGISFQMRSASQRQQVPKYATYKVFIPVVDAGWSEHMSAANLSWGVTLPVREIMDYLELRNYPQTFDLFDQDGRRAALFFEDGETFKDRQYFLYLRKDLLDHYLVDQRFKLIWIIRGERTWTTNVLLSSLGSSGDDTQYRKFQRVEIYQP